MNNMMMSCGVAENGSLRGPLEHNTDARTRLHDFPFPHVPADPGTTRCSSNMRSKWQLGQQPR